MQTLQGPYVYQHPHPLLFLGPHRSSLGSAGFDLPAVDFPRVHTSLSYNAAFTARGWVNRWQRTGSIRRLPQAPAGIGVLPRLPNSAPRRPRTL